MLYDPATVEACAKVAEGTAPIARGNFFKARREQTAKIASAIRSLTAGREIQSSDGGAKVASSAVLASEEDQRSGLHGVMPVGTIAASSGNTDAGPSEAIHAHQPSMPKYEYQKDAGEGGSVSYRDPVVRQDCAPAGTDTYDAMAAIQSGVMKVVHPSPSQPVAGLTEDERILVDAVTQQAGWNYRPSLVQADALLAIIDRLTRSAVSEEELARFLNPNAFKLAEAGTIYGRQQVNLATGTARALLSQFDVRRK